MKFLHKISVTTILGLLSIPTYAVPNVWTSAFTQGYTEYVLSNSKNQTIIVACNEYADIHSDHGFHYYPKGLNGNSLPLRNIRILFDNSTVAYPPQDGGLPTSTRGGANEWINFTRAISKAKKIDLYSNNKLIATFTPTSNSVKSIARELAKCKPAG
ncbi:hypothetical protein [Neisseria subflava]|uniref:hypothetical protein n=1 Tax=Neisseria subflava TaxID=28449 RepID=UPI002029FF27|nr:hypothetical protein [Neisseria subflava]MCL9779575.1 hypothetical protein [Neisseria subflava]